MKPASGQRITLYSNAWPHAFDPTSRRTAAIALAARALRAAGRKAKLKEYFHG